MANSDKKAHDDRQLDESEVDSFPASDPPANWAGVDDPKDKHGQISAELSDPDEEDEDPQALGTDAP